MFENRTFDESENRYSRHVQIKGTVMQIEKARIKMIACVFQKYPINFAIQIFIILL